MGKRQATVWADGDSWYFALARPGRVARAWDWLMRRPLIARWQLRNWQQIGFTEDSDESEPEGTNG
jgi:hypothetical protein